MKLLFSILILFTSIGYSQTGNIKVKVTGITNTKGNIEIGLYNKKEGFTEVDKVFKGVTLKSVQSELTYTFKNIPLGKYAIAVFHDENKDRVINENFFGVPTEYYGFSRNKYGTFGPPSFDVVSFKIVDGKTILLTINLK